MDSSSRKHGRLPFLSIGCVILGGIALAFGPDCAPAAWLGLILTHATVLCGCWMVSRALDHRRAPELFHLVLAGQLYLATVIAAGLVLGWSSMLTRWSQFSFLAAVGILLPSIAGRLATRPAATTLRLRRCGPYFLVLIAIVPTLIRVLVNPVIFYDAMTYHLTFPAQWIQDGAISVVPTWCGGPVPDYAPSCTEVFYALLMLPFHADTAARGGQVVFWLLLLTAFSALLKELRIGRWPRAALTFALALVPAICEQAASCLVDIAMAAQVVCLALFALRLAQTRGVEAAIGLAVTVGLLLGTKFLAITFLIAFAPLLFWAIYRYSRGAAAGKHKAALITALLVAGLVGPSWYLRNWRMTADPVYPLRVQLGGLTLFDGLYGSAEMANSWMNVRRVKGEAGTLWLLWQALQAWPGRPSGQIASIHVLCADATGMVLGAGLLAAPFVIFSGRGRRWDLLLLWLGAVLSLIYCILLVPIQHPRFLWGPLLCSAALLCHACRKQLGLQIAGWIGVCLIWIFCFLPPAAWSLGETVEALRSGKDSRSRQLESRRTMDFLCDAWREIDHDLHEATIANVGNNVPYFLYGRRLENRVLYVPARKPARGRLHDYAREMTAEQRIHQNTADASIDRYVMDPQIWLSNLRELGVTDVLVSSLKDLLKLTVNIRHDEDGFPVEKKWLDGLVMQGAAERREYSGGRVRLYHLNLSKPASLEGQPVIQQAEADALDQLRIDGGAIDGRIRNYPLAKPFIDQARLRILSTK